MTTTTSRLIGFIGRSLVWAVLLFAVTMTIVNWEDVPSYNKPNNAVTITDNGDTLLHNGQHVHTTTKNTHG